MFIQLRRRYKGTNAGSATTSRSRGAFSVHGKLGRKAAHVDGEGVVEDQAGALGACGEPIRIGHGPDEGAAGNEDARGMIDEPLEQLAVGATVDAPAHRRVG